MSSDFEKWMAGGVVENDREEARSARILDERCGNMLHPPDCRCSRSCIAEQMTPEDFRA